MLKIIKMSFYSLLSLTLVFALGSCGGGGSGDGGADQTEVADENLPNYLSQVCPIIYDIVPGMNIKYKSQNVHGGRGPSFIMGCSWNAKQYWPVSSYLATFPIYSARGIEIGKFVVFDPGSRPYGNRSYSGLPGGYPPDSQTLLNDAILDGAGSTAIYVNTKDNICFKVDDPTIDQGTIDADRSGEGRC